MRIVFVLLALVVGCDCSGGPRRCTLTSDCAAGQVCRDRLCVEEPDAPAMDRPCATQLPGEYRFYDEVPKGMEKIDAYRRWISEELLGQPRPFGKTSPRSGSVPLDRVVRRADA